MFEEEIGLYGETTWASTTLSEEDLKNSAVESVMDTIMGFHEFGNKEKDKETEK